MVVWDKGPMGGVDVGTNLIDGHFEQLRPVRRDITASMLALT